jgi:group II intron reverse transcriptase/maturase
MATKLVIEPIFEADFCENSYGFRPKRSAHDAIDDVRRTIRKGNVKVIDADLSKYFDSIPHQKLMAAVAKRIIDKGVLHLIKMWLKAPVVEEGEDGKKRITGGKKNQQGTPQGGVISPLLANIYLHLLDGIWEINGIEKRYNARLIRYADDCVILCKYSTDKAMKLLETVLKRLGLSLNEKKTKIVNVHHESFDFLGFTLFMRQSRLTKRRYLHIEPSLKSQNKIKERLRTLTHRNMTILSLTEIVDSINKMLRGWVNYFHHYNCSEVLNKVKNYAEERLRTHLCRRYKIRDRKTGIMKYPRHRLYEDYKLYKVPQTARWQTVHALQ